MGVHAYLTYIDIRVRPDYPQTLACGVDVPIIPPGQRQDPRIGDQDRLAHAKEAQMVCEISSEDVVVRGVWVVRYVPLPLSPLNGHQRPGAGLLTRQRPPGILDGVD